MKTKQYTYVQLWGKERRVIEGSFAHMCSKVSKFTNAIAGVIGVLLFVGVIFMGFDRMSANAFTNDFKYNATSVKVIVEEGDTVWSLTEKLNPGLDEEAISKLVESAQRIEDSKSVVKSSLNSLKVGQEIHVFCNKELAKELGLTK